MIRSLVAILVFANCGLLYADPLVYLTLEGRLQGTGDPFATNVRVAEGDSVEYRLRLQLAPSGTTNQHLEARGFAEPLHGINSLSIAIVQDANQQIQVDLASPVQLASANSPLSRGDWDRGTAARAGRPSLRRGSLWNDLLDIRPIQSPGVFSGAEANTVFTGLFNVALVSGVSGDVTAQWGPTSGGGWFDGYSFFLTGPDSVGPGYVPTEFSSDPLARFTPLTLTAVVPPIPEPSTVGLLAAALFGLAFVRVARCPPGSSKVWRC